MKMSGAADVFDLSVHIKIIIQHNPKTFAFRSWCYFTQPMDSCRSVANLERRDVIMRSSVLSSLILSLFFIIYDLMSHIHVRIELKTLSKESNSKAQYNCVSSA